MSDTPDDLTHQRGCEIWDTYGPGCTCGLSYRRRIADLERQLAEAESYPGIAHDFETVRRELEEARTEIANRAHTEEQYRLRIEDLERQLAEKQAEMEAMQPAVERLYYAESYLEEAVADAEIQTGIKHATGLLEDIRMTIKAYEARKPK